MNLGMSPGGAPVFLWMSWRKASSKCVAEQLLVSASIQKPVWKESCVSSRQRWFLIFAFNLLNICTITSLFRILLVDVDETNLMVTTHHALRFLAGLAFAKTTLKFLTNLVALSVGFSKFMTVPWLSCESISGNTLLTLASAS